MEDTAAWSLKRNALLASLGRYESFVANFCEQRDLQQVALRLDRFKYLWLELDEAQSKLEEKTTDEVEIMSNVEKRAEYESVCFRVQAKLESIIPGQTPVLENTASAVRALTGLKLPTISLPEFSGDFMQWLPFRNTYEGLIHDNAEVPLIQKFHYLRAALKGEAAQLIESIALSADHYEMAWDSVVQRYSNEYLLKRRHFAALFATPAITDESAITLHMLVDEFERHKKTLGQLGEPIEHWGGLLEHLLTTKLPMETLREWENYATTAPSPNYDLLVEFLRRRMRMLESLMVSQDQVAHTPATSLQRHTTRRVSSARVATFSAATRVGSCAVCKHDHGVASCPRFMDMNIAARKRLIQSLNLCNNCLRPNHLARDCANRARCRHCGQRHHSLVHLDQVNERSNASPLQLMNSPQPASREPAARTTTRVEQSFVAAAGAYAHDSVFLQTALVSVLDAFGQPHQVRALLDSASQPNIITERLARRLNLRRSPVSISLEGAGNAATRVKEKVWAELRSRSSDYVTWVEMLVVDKLLPNLPSQSVDISRWNIPHGIVLADPTFHTAQPVDIIIGARHYHTLFGTASRLHLGSNLPVMMDSVFGWVVTGATSSGPSNPDEEKTSITVATCMVSLEAQLERFWKSEELLVKNSYSVEEIYCEETYRQTTTRDESGRYIVRLPKKPGFEAMLGASKESATRRFAQLEKRFHRDPNLKAEYQQFMREYIDLGHMNRAEDEKEMPVRSYYLPHHAVFKDASTTTKVRVVFDGSAKTSTGHSLNDLLCTGPVVQDDLLDVILRFRTYRIALVGDIAKMYRQVWIHNDDRSLLRIFFRWNNDSPPETYELATVTYGLAPSSFLATRTIQQLAEDEGKAFPLAEPAVRYNFYVDDFIGGANDIQETKRLRIELNELMSKGGFELRKWTSNRLEVLEGLSDDLIGTQSTREFMPNEMIKTLGIAWEPEWDTLGFGSFEVSPNKQNTKRGIVSEIARLFDPLGMIAPVVITGKIFIQRLWQLRCGWDEPISTQMQNSWDRFACQIPLLAGYKIKRYALLPNARIELHAFCDASEAAYGACIYARCEDEDGNVRIALLASKSRVAPLKKVTLPRLELNAAVLSAHLYDRVQKALRTSIADAYFWSDSSITLHWIDAPPGTWKTYVANRVAEIQHFTCGGFWRHIPGLENPADLVSRGMSVFEFRECKMWSNGPTWLALPKQHWPTLQPPNTGEVETEKRLITTATTSTHTIHPWFERYSSYTKLIRVIANCWRFISKLKKSTQSNTSGLERTTQIELTADWLQKAETALARLAQQDAFGAEIALLKKGNYVGRNSPLKRLSPLIDESGLIRVGGRLKLSQLPYQAKHPIVLPKKHPLALRIGEHYHLKLIHGGGRLLLSHIREKYWPLDGRNLVKGIVRHCFRCARYQPTLAQQQMGQLPASRTTPNRPFSITGVDYAGPLYLKPIHKRAASLKAYLCVFVCFCTKAVHLELVSDLSTDGFMAALHRFTSRRGLPAHIHSDNGKNFEGAKNELAELFELFENEQQQKTIAASCAEQGITWHFTPPKAPHFGGLWEAAVKTAKRHLYRQLGNVKLCFEGYCTVLHQIEAAMNSRPLLPMSEDPNELAALTPAHFLVGSSLLAVPEPDYTALKPYGLNELQKRQLLVQKFWKHWSREYLQELQKDTRLASRNNEIVPGRMVILMDDLLPPTRWPLARVVQLHPGLDNMTRVVTLRTTRGEIVRPITKICVLPNAPKEYANVSIARE